MTDTTITIYNTPRGYMARYSGAEEPEIRRLFHTDTIPTAFTARANPQYVLDRITLLNPGCDVVLAAPVVPFGERS